MLLNAKLGSVRKLLILTNVGLLAQITVLENYFLNFRTLMSMICSKLTGS